METAGTSYGNADLTAAFDEQFTRATTDASPIEPITTLFPLCDFEPQ